VTECACGDRRKSAIHLSPTPGHMLVRADQDKVSLVQRTHAWIIDANTLQPRQQLLQLRIQQGWSARRI
jgi:hypothetical protein